MATIFGTTYSNLSDAERTELHEEAAAHGLRPEEALAARLLGMPTARYAHMRNIRSIDDYGRVKRAEQEQQEARDEARRQRLVDDERRGLGGGPA